jgi:hypothetical protein
MKRRFDTVIAAVSTLLAFPPAFAHHSYAQFDTKLSVTLQGSVRELQWTNPHCFIQLLVPEAGTVVEWSVEMNSPIIMYRAGWRPGTFNSGDKVTIVIHPTRDGTHGGSLVSAVGSDGRTLTTVRPRS